MSSNRTRSQRFCVSSSCSTQASKVQELLAEAGLTRESTLDAVEARLESDPRFTSLPDSLDMDRVFADVMEVRVPEFDFWDLLRECRSPPLTRDTTWGQARRQVPYQHA